MKESKQIGIYKKYLREHLSKKRYTHSLNVAFSAVELAKKYGRITDVLIRLLFFLNKNLHDTGISMDFIVIGAD